MSSSSDNIILHDSDYDLDVLLDSKYLESISFASNSVVSKKFSWLPDDYIKVLDITALASLGLAFVSLFTAWLASFFMALACVVGGLSFFFLCFLNFLIFTEWSAANNSRSRFMLEENLSKLGLYSFNSCIDIPTLCSIEKDVVDDGLLLKIVDRNKKVVRSQFFNMEQNQELYETIVEWENELIDFQEDNVKRLEDFKVHHQLKLEREEEKRSLSKEVDQLLLSSNTRISSE